MCGVWHVQNAMRVRETVNFFHSLLCIDIVRSLFARLELYDSRLTLYISNNLNFVDKKIIFLHNERATQKLSIALKIWNSIFSA